MNPIALAIFALCVTAGCILLFSIERSRGKRYFPRVRGYADRSLSSLASAVHSQVPEINAAFFRQFFHYSVHRTLSRLLKIIKGVEKGMNAGVRLNKKKATERVLPSTDSHLQQVADHKVEMALSEDEKAVRKDAALRGDPALSQQRPVGKKAHLRETVKQ